MALLVGVGKMHGGRRAWTFRLDHLHRNRWPIDAGPTPGRIHLKAIKKSTIGVLELHERITNLQGLVSIGGVARMSGLEDAYVTGGESFESLEGLGYCAHLGLDGVVEEVENPRVVSLFPFRSTELPRPK